LNFEFQAIPIERKHPAFPDDRYIWEPRLPVQVIFKHSPPSKRIEAIVDSGSPYCLFHAGFCHSLGMKLEKGKKELLKGVIGGHDSPTAPMYFHKVKILVGLSQFETWAGFSWHLSCACLLGQKGFFENFEVTFDWSSHPPSSPRLRVERIIRA